jgi:hypothetical protein
MRLRLLSAVLLTVGLVAGGCGWSPPSAPPRPPDTCTPGDGPTPETVTNAINALPAAEQGPWHEIGRGHTYNCHFYWVQASAGTDPTAPQHLLFFDHNTSLGTATPQARPYTTVIATSQDTITVNYQYEKSGDVTGKPTGVGQVRFQLGEDGKIKALDPIPG